VPEPRTTDSSPFCLFAVEGPGRLEEHEAAGAVTDVSDDPLEPDEVRRFIRAVAHQPFDGAVAFDVSGEGLLDAGCVSFPPSSVSLEAVSSQPSILNVPVARAVISVPSVACVSQRESVCATETSEPLVHGVSSWRIMLWIPGHSASEPCFAGRAA
jgi:hypothetical protein